jgi:uncharacterized delta-60 repeat protein
VALQADGKIVAVGGAAESSSFAVARYNSNGSLDTSFSGDGLQTTQFPFDTGDPGDATGAASDVAVQPDGRIVVAGYNFYIGSPRFGLARYNADGSLDTTFSGDGVQTTDNGSGIGGIALQADGKIVAVGGHGFSDYFVLARYTTGGSLDPAFSGDGQVTTVVPPGGGQGYDVVIQPDGRIVAAGETSDRFAVARYEANGSLDTSFSGDGSQNTEFPGVQARARSVALDASGRIILVGSGGGSFLLARYEGGGTPPPPDTTPPQTTIASGPAEGSLTNDSTPTFEFNSSEPSSTFSCKIDMQPASSCLSPFTTEALGDGQHTFAVFATDDSGNVDPTPAARTFTVATSVTPPPPPPPAPPPPPPTAPPPPPPPIAPPPSDTVAPTATISGAAQRLAKTVSVSIACLDEACTAVSVASVLVPRVGAHKAKTYKLKTITTQIGRGQKVAIKFALQVSIRSAIKRALALRKRVVVAVKVSVTDAAGNRRSLRRQVRLKR